jgi:hypothetical protein
MCKAMCLTPYVRSQYGRIGVTGYGSRLEPEIQVLEALQRAPSYFAAHAISKLKHLPKGGAKSLSPV